MLSNAVLIVEDDASLRPLMVRVLSANGFVALCAATAEEALRLWEDTAKEVPVAIVDLTLPGEISGEVLVQRLKTDNPHLSVVITSGRLAPEELVGCIKDAAYLQKPFMPAELIAVVRAAFAKLLEVNVPPEQSPW